MPGGMPQFHPQFQSVDLPMLPYAAPDERDGLSILYASHSPESLMVDGRAVVVVPPSEATNCTFCAILDFPTLPALLAPEEAAQIQEKLVEQTKSSYFSSPRQGFEALFAVLHTLHLYLQFTNQNRRGPALIGQASCAEIRDRLLRVAFTDGTFNVVIKAGEGVMFPSRIATGVRGLGSPEPLEKQTYQSEILGTGNFFLGSGSWVTQGVATHQLADLKADFARAVAFSLTDEGQTQTDFFHARNPDRAMTGVLMGYPPRRAEAAEQANFVPPAAEAPETRAVASREGMEGDDPASSEEVMVAEGAETIMHSALEDLDRSPPRPQMRLRRLGQWSQAIGQRMRSLAVELFPDSDQEPPPAPPTFVEGQDPGQDPESSSATSSASDPKVPPVRIQTQTESVPDPDPQSTLPPPTFDAVKADYQVHGTQAGQTGSWVPMMLLCLIVVVPIASWLAFRINDIPDTFNDGAPVAQVRGHLETAKTLLSRGQFEAAQEQLQAARDTVQSVNTAQGLSPDLKVLQVEILTLWNDAYQIVPLVGLTEPLIRFPRDAAPAKVIVDTQDIYVLDTDADAVTKYRLDALRNGTPHEPRLIVQKGGQADGIEVGHIMDMAYQPTKTAHSDKPSLYLIDDRRNIFQYNDTDSVSYVDLGQKGTWDTPTLIDFYSNRMYVADAGKGQIWRYNFNSSLIRQESWLAETVDLSQALRMHVDNQVWLLFASNSVVLLGQSEDGNDPINVQKPFGVRSAISFSSEFVDLEVGSQQSDYLLLVDTGQNSIQVLSKSSGDFQHQLVAPEGMDNAFADLRDVFVHRNIIYILTGTALYEHAFAQ